MPNHATHPNVFSFLDVFSPCVTYTHDNTFQWFKPRVKKLEEKKITAFLAGGVLPVEGRRAEPEPDDGDAHDQAPRHRL